MGGAGGIGGVEVESEWEKGVWLGRRVRVGEERVGGGGRMEEGSKRRGRERGVEGVN